MTTPAPLYRYTYVVETDDGPVRGNTTGRDIAHVRRLLTVAHGAYSADLATITLASVEETTNE
jgi:hypothetical protein